MQLCFMLVGCLLLYVTTTVIFTNFDRISSSSGVPVHQHTRTGKEMYENQSALHNADWRHWERKIKPLL